MKPIEEIDYVALRGVEWMHLPYRYPHLSMHLDFGPFSGLFTRVQNITSSIIYETNLFKTSTTNITRMVNMESGSNYGGTIVNPISYNTRFFV